MIEQDGQFQIVASSFTWEKAKTLRFPFWMRILLCCGGVLALALSLIAWLLSKFLVFFDILTGCWIRPFHRFVHRCRRRIRWAVALSLTAIFAGPNPRLAIAFIMSYCYLYSHDAPESWIHWLATFQ